MFKIITFLIRILLIPYKSIKLGIYDGYTSPYDIDAFWTIRRQILDSLPSRRYWKKHKNDDIVVFCIGTELAINTNGVVRRYDSFGPRVGTILKDILEEKSLDKVYVYGALGDNIHATNIHNFYNLKNQKHKKSYDIAIDACVSDKIKQKGKIKATTGFMTPGSGNNLDLGAIGDVAITGITIVKKRSKTLLTKDERTEYMAKITAFAVYSALDKISKYRK